MPYEAEMDDMPLYPGISQTVDENVMKKAVAVPILEIFK